MDSTDTNTNEATESVPTTDEGAAFCAVVEAIPEDVMPQRLAEAVCARWAVCGCAQAEEAACGAGYFDYFTGLRTFAQEHGLDYDGYCLARHIQEFAASGCSKSDMLEREMCDLCYVYSGHATAGETCDIVPSPYRYSVGFVNSCAGILNTCSTNEYCEPPPGEGDFCFEQNCADGLACTGDLMCTPAGVGEQCAQPSDEFTGCAPNLWCENSTCREGKAIGASCLYNEQCATGRCADEICVDYEFACELNDPYF